MKKLTIILLFLSVQVFGQLTPVPDYRVQDATTAFGINVPIGAKIYNYGTGDYYVATAAIASTATITTASGSLSSISDLTVSFTGGTNVTIGGTYPSFTITDNTLSQTQINGLISDSIAAIDLLTQQVDNGDKTASFTHDATSASIGNYNLSTTSAVTVSIHNLTSGKQGTIFLDIGASNPSSVTISLYSDAGSTAITAGNTRGSTSITTTANEMSTVTYTCASDGTNTEVILISSTGL